MSMTGSEPGRPRQTLNLWAALSQQLVFALVMVGGGLVPLVALADDAIYRDPRQPSFTLLVPDGWTAETNRGGVTIRRGTSWAQVNVKPGIAEPSAVLVQVRPQFERQWKNFREVESGEVMLSGYKGAYAVYTGIPPSGVNEITKLLTMTTGQMTYVLVIGARPDEYRLVRGDLDRIQASFAADRSK